MTVPRPSPRQRQFLRGIAAVNPHTRGPDHDGRWWSAYDLQHTMLFSDFRLLSTMSLAGLGRSCEVKGLALSRRTGQHGWTEYRITTLGRGLVSDSCIGGGLPWRRDDDSALICPACGETAVTILTAHATGTGGTIPVHPLPGYLPEPTTATEERSS